MKRVKLTALGWLALLAMPLVATADLFGLGDSDKVAVEVAVLDEDTQPGAIALSPDGRQLAVDSWGNGGTNIWDLDQKRIVNHMPEGGAGTSFKDLISYSPSGKQFAICHAQGPSNINIDVYDTASWKIIHSLGDAERRLNGSGGCAAITFTPDGRELIRLGGSNIFRPGNNVIFYDTSSWQVTRGFRTEPLVDDPNNAISANNAIRDPINWTVLDTPDTILIDPSNNKTSFHPNTLSISKDGKYLALIGDSYVFEKATNVQQSVAVIVDISNRSLVHVIHGQAGSLDWNPDNVHLAFGQIDNVHLAFGQIDYTFSIKIFDSSSNKTVVSEEAGPSNILVRYTPDGKYLIEKVGKKVEIWDGQHQKLLQVIKAEPSYIAVSLDGRYFAMGGAKNSILDATAMLSLITHPNGPSGKVIVYKLK
jgi:WD40 repeat protein